MGIVILSAMIVFSTTDTAPAPENSHVADRDTWQPSIQAVFEQLNTLDLFAAATRLGGMTVKVPRELQALPMRMIEGADDLRDRGIEIHVKELQFRDLNFIYDNSPDWDASRPLIPTMIEFGRLAFSAEVKTRIGAAPVGATFENGRMPVDFLPMLDKGYELALLPERRHDETILDNVRLQVAGPVATRIANRFFSDKVTRLILEHGVGQTLQMGQGDLFAGDTALRLLDVNPDSRRGRAVESLIDGLRR